MNSKKEIKNYLNDFNAIYSFDNTEILYDDENFGNIFVKLHDKDGVVLNFIRDRGQVWGEIGTQKEMFLIEDVLEALQLDLNLEDHNFLNMVDRFLRLYIEEHSKVLKAFSPPELRQTKSKVKKIGKKKKQRFF